MSRVFILEHTQLDVVKAREYGEVVYMFPPNVRRSSIWDERFCDEVIERLVEMEYDPCVDYFVVVGHMVQMVLAATTICGRWERFKALLFSSTERNYIPRIIGAKHSETSSC